MNGNLFEAVKKLDSGSVTPSKASPTHPELRAES
jgi:hypothetical protein